MLSIDPPEEDESDDAKSTGRNTPTPGRTTPRVPPMTIRIGEDGGVVPKEEETEINVENNEDGADNTVCIHNNKVYIYVHNFEMFLSCYSW